MKHLQFPLLFLFILLVVPGLLAGQEQPPRETWIRTLPPPAKSFRNDHYRYEIWSFQDAKGQDFPVLHVEIYPEEQLRTRLLLGTAKAFESGDPALQKFQFTQTAKAEALRMPKPEGFPVSTFLRTTGLLPFATTTEFTYAALPPLENQPRTALINGKTYENLNDVMKKLAWATPNTTDMGRFLQLFFIQVFTHEARIKDFGSNAMINIKLKVPGIAASWLNLDFEARGFLGLENSGIMFTLNRTSDFPGLAMGGKLFAGVNRNEGTMTLSQVGPASEQILGTFDCTQLIMAGGVPAKGKVLIRTPAMKPEDPPFAVDFSVVGD